MKKLQKSKGTSSPKPKVIYAIDVPKSFIEYCLEKAQTEEQKRELKELLVSYSRPV